LAACFNGTRDLIFGLHVRGFSSHPELVLGNPLTRILPAPAIAIGTLLSVSFAVEDNPHV